MALPTISKAKAQYIDRDYRSDNTKNNRLSIQLRPDGFSFAQIDSISKKVLFIEDYQIPIMLGDEAVFQCEKVNLRFETFLSETKLYSQIFKSVHIIIDNSFFTIVPNVLFKESESDNYLKITHQLPVNFIIKIDSLTLFESKNVFGVYAPLYYTISDYFHQFEFKHFVSLFIYQSAIFQKTKNEAAVYVYVNANNIIILAFENDKLIFSNSFNFKEKEDFVYYILLIYNQLKFKTENTPLYFSGNIDSSSPLYAIAYQYIGDLNFSQQKSGGVIFGKDFPEFAESKYSVLTQAVL